MNRHIQAVLALGALALSGAVSAGAPVAEPVAPGFPAWEGVTEKNHIWGLSIDPAELRQRVTIIVEFEAEKADVQLPPLKALGIWASPFGGDAVWERLQMNREYIVLFSNRGGRDKPAKGGIERLGNVKQCTLNQPTSAPVYHDVKFPGGPDAGGKYPMIYVMPPEGTTPVTNVFGDAKGLQVALAAARACRTANKDRERVEFTGVAEPKFLKSVQKAVAAGKPMTASLAAARVAIKSKDPEQAREGQIVYDSIMQARGDLLYRIRMEMPFSPVRACYDAARLLKYFPAEKKNMAAVDGLAKTMPDVVRLTKIFTRVTELEDDSFVPKNAGVAKKIVQELGKYAKQLKEYESAKDIRIQNAAMFLSSAVDNLIEKIPAIVPEK